MLHMIGNPVFMNMAAFTRCTMTVGRALAGAVQRSSMVAALKSVCNRLMHRPAPSPPGRCMDGHAAATHAVHGSFSAAATSSKAPDSMAGKHHDVTAPPIKNLEELKSQLGIVGFLKPAWQSEPLGVLGRQILSLPEEDQLPAIEHFRKAVEKLPESHRRGLLGMYLAAQKNHRVAFSEWRKDAMELVKSEILQSDAKFSHASRQAIAAMYGLTDNWSLRQLELSVLHGPARELLTIGSSADEALKKHDLGPAACWEALWGCTRSGFDQFAFDRGPAKKEVEEGEDYLEVAKKYGIGDYFVLQKMKACEVNAYLSRTAIPPT